MMKLKDLSIRQDYVRDNMYKGEVTFRDSVGSVSLNLTDEQCRSLLVTVATELIEQAAKSADLVADAIMTAATETPKPAEAPK